MLLEFGLLYLQFLPQQLHSIVGGELQQCRYIGEDRLLVLYDAAVRRDRHLAVGEGIQGVNRLVGRSTRRQLYDNLCLLGSEVINLLYLYLSALLCFEDSVDNLRCSCAERHLADDERLVVIRLADTRTNLDHTSTLAVIVTTHIHFAAGGEVRIERELFAAQVSQRRVAQFVEVVRQNL